MGKEIIGLHELQTRLKEGVEHIFPSKLWLKAEISAVKARPGGHCYMELSQSGEDGLLAKAQAIVWASRYRFIAPFFESVTGSPLSEGMEVLVRVQVNYSQLYGMSLIIDDIDPDFSLGEKERERQRTLARLKEEALMDMQQKLQLPKLPYCLAVVSAPDAAGYRDFMRHLHENGSGFVFRTELFPALMQGAGASASIIAAMDAALASGIPFDALLILRGGGARLDLACYDEYPLAEHVARFPVPVFTAIGHDQDVHICDMVAWTSVKTPTALADAFIGMYTAEDNAIASYAGRLKLAFLGKINAMESRIRLLEARITGADPRNILKRGYVLTVDSAGLVIKGVAGRKPGDRIRLMYHDGNLGCTVSEVEEKEYGGKE